jgi:hypothetical protein
MCAHVGPTDTAALANRIRQVHPTRDAATSFAPSAARYLLSAGFHDVNNEPGKDAMAVTEDHGKRRKTEDAEDSSRRES